MGNINAYKQAAPRRFSVDARLLRFIPLAYVGQPCMRVEVWGESKLQLRCFVLITARKFIFGEVDSHWLLIMFVLCTYYPLTIVNYIIHNSATFSSCVTRQTNQFHDH